MAVRQHVIRANCVNELLQLLVSTSPWSYIVIEVVRIDIGKTYTVHNSVQVTLTISWRMLNPFHTYFKHSFLIGNANLQTYNYIAMKSLP